jgi:hypothetical protein
VAIDLTELGVAPFGQVSTVRIGSLGTERSVDPVLFMGINSVAASIPGDFNNDRTVNASDYVVWRNGLGTTHTQADYNTWRANFGETTGSSAAHASVPEPMSAVLWLIALGSLISGLKTTPQGRTVREWSSRRKL